MANKKSFGFLKIKMIRDGGQSTVEYIMLLAVVMALFFTVYKSGPFQNFLGQDSDFFNNIATRLRLDYRYAKRVIEDDDIGSAPVENHPSFASSTGESQFFGYEDGEDYPPN